MNTTITPALIEGLARPTGAIPNGPNLERPPQHRATESNRNREIRIVQPAAGRWSCDSCEHTGDGGGAMLHHAAVTNHLVYTALD